MGDRTRPRTRVHGLAAACLAFALPAQDPDHAGRITGVVSDEVESPVPAARISVLDDRRQIVRAALGDGSGTFLLTGLPLRCETLFVRAEAKGMAAAETSVKLRWFDPEVALRVRLRGAETLLGRVRGGDDRPLAGADVVVVSADSSAMPLAARTDANGCFVVPSVAIGDATVLVMADGHTAHVEPVRLPRADELALRLQHGDGHVLRIRIEGADDEQIRAMSAWLHASPQAGRGAVALTIPDIALTGTETSVRNLPTDHRWHVVLGGKAPAGGGTFGITASEAERDPSGAGSFTLRLAWTEELAGRVLGPGERPCAGLHLKVRSLGASFGTLTVTDGEGRFRIRSPAELGRQVEFFALDRDWTLDTAPVGAGLQMWGIQTAAVTGESIELRATPAAVVRGRIVDADGNGVPSVPLFIQAAPAPGIDQPTQYVWGTTSDADGSYAFGRHAATDQPLWLRVGPLQSSLQQGPFTLARGEHKVLEVRLPPATRHEGRVEDARGRPLPGARVVLREQGTTWFAGRDGRFAFTSHWWPRDGRLMLADVTGGEAPTEVGVATDGLRHRWTIRARER